MMNTAGTYLPDQYFILCSGCRVLLTSLMTFLAALSAVFRWNGWGLVVTSSCRALPRRLGSLLGLVVPWPEEVTEGTRGEGSMGRSLWAAGVERRLRSRAAMLPGKLALRSISSALMRRLNVLWNGVDYLLGFALEALV